MRPYSQRYMLFAAAVFGPTDHSRTVLQAEKEMAEEQARQAEAQAQALIEERSRMKVS